MISDPHDTVKSRCRYVLMAFVLRKPLATTAILLGILGVLQNTAGVDFLFRPSSYGASTHPLTGLAILLLATFVRGQKGFRPIPVMRNIILGCVLSLICAKVLIQNIVSVPLPSSISLSSWGQMGTDTGISLALLHAAVLLQRKNANLGLLCAFSAASFIGSSFLAFSYGHVLFEGQMAVATLVALVPLTLSVLTLYARRPMMRVIMLAGPVGERTRNAIAVGSIVPWFGGLLLYRWIGVPERVIPAEALIVGATILSITLVAVASGLFHERVDRARRELSRELMEMASTDHLTKLLNRNGITFELEKKWAAFHRFGTSQCVMMMDLDHFKKINYEFGHDQGDRVLTGVSKRLRPCLRSGDSLGRWGGEEFIVLLQDVDKIRAIALAERMRKAVASMTFEGIRTKKSKKNVTASIGVAFFKNGDCGYEESIKRADLALYEAKTKGRNRVDTVFPNAKSAA